MTRSEERPSHRGDGGGGGRGRGRHHHHHHHHHQNNRHGPLPRQVLVSKALSRLLRHAAAQERVPIDNHGYVRMDHLLAWQRLKSMQPRVTFDEVVDVVLENEKKRFALKYVDGDDQRQQGQTQEDAETEAGAETETKRAISQYEAIKVSGGGQLDTRQVQRFFVRATQGHSMATVEAENLLTPITLEDPNSVPDTVVHGTFYGSWEAILSSGGLKKMNRNHVHFATGPRYKDVMDRVGVTQDGHDPTKDGQDGTTATEGDVGGDKGDDNGKGKSSSNDNTTSNETLLQKNKVISGMRSDAQILVYVDIRRALTEQPGMKWWRSENGVILTDGVVLTTTNKVDVAAGDGDDELQDRAQNEKVVPTKYFSAAVEIKQGLGLLYEDGKGVVSRLPERLRTKGVPGGKGGRG